MKVFSTNQVRDIDQYTIQNEPISSTELMERAASAFADTFSAMIPTEHKVFIFAGPGNNGGDALAIAQLLNSNGYRIKVYLFNPKGKLSSDCEKNRQRLLSISSVEFTEVKDSFTLPEISKADVIIDGLFGSGLTQPLAGGFASLVKQINKSDAYIVSIDIPSGLFGEDNSGNTKNTVIICANKTLTFQFPKLAFFFPDNYRFVGDWKVLDIGLLPEAMSKTKTSFYTIEKESVKPILKLRNTFAHKGDFGHALLIAGSYGKMGAGILSAKACLRSGVGLLTVHIPRYGVVSMQASVPEAIASIDNHEKYFTEVPDLTKYDAIGIGPGSGKNELTSDAFILLLTQANIPLVLDADALNMLNTHEKISLIPKGSILTPHVGEFDLLAGISPMSSSYQRLQAAIEFAAQTETYLVLKGAYTAICTPDRNCFFNTTGNPGMATAGSGDVLTGIILSLLAQGYPPFESTVLGVYLHGLSGDIAVEKSSPEGLIAGDIVQNLPFAFREIRN